MRFQHARLSVHTGDLSCWTEDKMVCFVGVAEMQMVTLIVALMAAVLGGDQVVSADDAAKQVEQAFAGLSEPLKFEVTLAGVEYRPKGTVPAVEGLTDKLAEDCAVCCLTDVTTNALTAGGGYLYVLDGEHRSDGMALRVRDAEGEFLWSWIAKDGSARESFKDEPLVVHPLPENNPNGTNIPLTYGDRLTACPVRSYRTSFLEKDGKIRSWFSRQVAKSQRKDSPSSDVELWSRERKKNWEDGSRWERVDVVGLDCETHLPLVWDSRTVTWTVEGKLERVICKTRRFKW